MPSFDCSQAPGDCSCTELGETPGSQWPNFHLLMEAMVFPSALLSADERMCQGRSKHTQVTPRWCNSLWDLSVLGGHLSLSGSGGPGAFHAETPLTQGLQCLRMDLHPGDTDRGSAGDRQAYS